MPAKKIACFLTALLLFSTLTYSVSASSNTTVTFHGVSITVNLTFPEEAHPSESITHNITITANVALTLQNLTIVIKAPVNTGWQGVKNQTITFLDLLENQNLTSSMNITLPQATNGTLLCYMYVQTDKSVDYSSYKFYTTRVSELTFSEMQSLYYEMLANYTSLQANYQSLLNDYNGLLANYSSLFANYTTLLSEHNELLADYNSQVATYQALLSNYNKLSDDYDALNANYKSKISEQSILQADYNDLNSNHNTLAESYDTLHDFYTALNDTYINLKTDFNSLQKRITDSENDLNNDRIVMLIFIITLAALIAFIIYIKRKKQEPYVVIRKETVSMEPDETS